MTRRLMFEGFEVGDRIRAFDFEPCEGRPDRYIEGKILEVDRDGGAVGYAHYVVEVELDTSAPPGARLAVLVPMQTLFDYAGRVTRIDS